jgi:hypothetical protein
MERLGVKPFTPQELLTLKDPQDGPVGDGLMAFNEEGTHELPCEPKQVLDWCYHCGNWLGVAISYSGAGTMRTPQLCCITIVDINSGSKRSLRLIDGQTCCRYNAIKQVSTTVVIHSPRDTPSICRMD